MNEEIKRLNVIARRLDAEGHHDIVDELDDVMAKMAASSQWWDTSDPQAGGFHGRMLGKDANTGGDWFLDPRGNFFYRGSEGQEWKQYIKKGGEWAETGKGEGYEEKGKFLPEDASIKGKMYQDEVGNYWHQDPGTDDWVQYRKGERGWSPVSKDDSSAWKPYKGKMLGQDAGGNAWYKDEAGRHWAQEGPGDPWVEYARGEGGWNPVGGASSQVAPSTQKTQPMGQSQTVTTPGGNRILIGPDGQAHSEDGRPVIYYNGNWYHLGTTEAVDKGAAPLFKDDAAASSATSTVSKPASQMETGGSR